jgi:CMP-N-acetylneuraminic acid synthetase
MNARLESSRLERKMVRPFAGTTLIDIALEKLDRLAYFDHRFLAVAEPELKERARRHDNVEILERRAEAVVRGPHPVMVTFEHYTRIPTEYIFVINPCSAFLSPATIRRAFDLVQSTEHLSYLAVIPTREWVFDAEGRPLTHKDPRALQNTNSGSAHYKASQAFYVINRDRFLETGGLLWTLTPGDPRLVEMPSEEAHDVDTELEFDFASFLYARQAAGQGSGHGSPDGR